MPDNRVVVWFSCGAASAIAAKLAIDKYSKDRVFVVYCDTSASEHPDNMRFIKDVENWLDKPIKRLKNPDFTHVEEVFDKVSYMSGIYGAPCTVKMKKLPRFEFQLPDDIHIFGFTLDEIKRINNFESRNPDLSLEWILRDNEVTKQDCYEILLAAEIALPAMYLLGYKNNNCLGCVKASSPAYWAKIRRDFPEVFIKRCEQSRRLGAKLIIFKGKRIFLDELPADTEVNFSRYKQGDVSCGPECGVVFDV